jgi:DNA modification methylase
MGIKINSVNQGDCLELMKQIGDNKLDAIVTDPPYGLDFMGKDWDHGVPGIPYWQEALRIAKPGAHLLAFGGTRTYHRLTVAIEDAGWEIRDCLMWLYGSGFPKSMDISKAIDKAAGADREVIGTKRTRELPNDVPFGQGLISSHANALAGRKTNGQVDIPITAPSTDAAKQWNGWGTALKPAWEPIIMARKPVEGTVADNVQKYGTGGINIDACRIVYRGEADKQSAVWGKQTGNINAYGKGMGAQGNEKVLASTVGRFPANLLLDEEAAAQLDAQTGTLTSGKGAVKRKTAKENDGNKGAAYGNESRPEGTPMICYGDSGGASRFFYCAKASRSERGEGNDHPTVKPLSLMAYLCKLVTPPNGIVLDPFMGSGSTIVAAKSCGFRYVGMDLEEKYCQIALRRLNE